jgi:hypothetical protein
VVGHGVPAYPAGFTHLLRIKVRVSRDERVCVVFVIHVVRVRRVGVKSGAVRECLEDRLN